MADDSEFQRWRCARTLRELGHDVLEASNGSEAVAMYIQEMPQATLLDITMPEMDGLEALRKIRDVDPAARSRLSRPSTSGALSWRRRRSGATAFVPKPIRLEVLDTIVQKLIRNGKRPPSEDRNIRLAPT